jgi:predicted regulator of Ras-like GTPase activity (Roadblock/LC7/MglB family)
MTDPMVETVRRLTRIPGSRGALIVDADAGVTVASELADGVSETALAALTGSLFRRAAEAAGTSGQGRVRVLQLDATEGHLVVANAGPLLVAVIASVSAQLGMVRVQTARAAEELIR